jgi:hypothetical protein
MSGCPFSSGQQPVRRQYPSPDRSSSAVAGGGGISRRTLLRAALAGGALAGLGALDTLSPVRRLAFAAPATLPDIQYAIGSYLAPAVVIAEPGAPAAGTLFGFGPTYTLFLTAVLTRTPSQSDRTVLGSALDTIEANYPFSADGVFTHISYGIPYFQRLPGGMTGSLVASKMPRLSDDPSRMVLEEAVPGPTDISPANPTVSKPRFNVPVSIEANDVLFTLRSDHKDKLYEIQNWLAGSNVLAGKKVGSPVFKGLFRFTSTRLMFGGRGMPRAIADANGLPYASYIHPDSPMWMGFADQVANAFGPPEICSFQGNPSAKLTNAVSTDYFGNSSIQVLNHNILDLTEWYLTNGTERTPMNPDVTYLERVQYMYRPHDPPAFGRDDQFTDGGGPTFLPNDYRGPDDARLGCEFGSYQPGGSVTNPGVNTLHKLLGHISTLQRTSRAADGTPLHIRVDGPGFDSMDVPDGSNQPKLHFSALVPSADLFRRMRVSQASLDLAKQYGVEINDQGLESRITATRRQNFLMPRRAHRAFPLLELAKTIK